MTDTKNLVVPEFAEVEAAHIKPPRRGIKKGLKWAFLAILVLLALGGVKLRNLPPYRHVIPRWHGGTRGILEEERLERRPKLAPVTEEEAREMLLKDKLKVIIDGHNDLPYMIRLKYGNVINGEDFNFWKLPGHVDGDRLKKSNVLGTFWSLYVGCPTSDFDENGVEFGDGLYAKAVHDTFQQMDLVKRLIKQNDDILTPATSTSDFPFGRPDDNGFHSLPYYEKAVWCWFTDGLDDVDKCIFERTFIRRVDLYEVEIDTPKAWLASVMGAEGLHQIGNSIANLRSLYDLGVRYMTLTHGCNNKYADSATAPGGPRWGGLSKDGRKLVKEMNRLGMLVDLSHVSADVMRQVLTNDTTLAPVIFSHSSAFALCPHPRNVPDDVLHLVKENKGVVMVNFYPEFVSCGPGKSPANATLGMVADHIEYIGKLIGWEHVGIGSDFDGIDTVPVGLEDVSKFPDLTAELLRRGVTPVDVVKISGLNVLRVWMAAELVSDKMQQPYSGRYTLPLEDDTRFA